MATLLASAALALALTSPTALQQATQLLDQAYPSASYSDRLMIGRKTVSYV